MRSEKSRTILLELLTYFLTDPMTLPVTTKIKLQYNGGCRNTYFETKRSGRNDEQNKINEVKIKWVYLVYKFYDSSCLFKPSGSNISTVPVKSIKKDSLAFLWLLRSLNLSLRCRLVSHMYCEWKRLHFMIWT